MATAQETHQMCSACKEPIQKDAAKCPHCASEQRLVTVSSGSRFIGAVLALISLCTLAVAAVRPWFEGEAASLVGAVGPVDQTGVYFSLSNTGNRAATIMQGSVKGTFPEGSCKGIAEFEDTLDSGSLLSVIEPGKTVEYKASFHSQQQFLTGTFVGEVLADPEMRPMLDRYKTCELTIGYVDFDTSFRQATIPFSCFIQADCSAGSSETHR